MKTIPHTGTIFGRALSAGLALMFTGCAPNEHALSHRVFSTIQSEPSFGPHAVDLAAQSGAVVLTGEVSTEQDRRLVYDAASGNYGVANVRDNLKIIPAEEGPRAMLAPASTEGPAYISDADRQLVETVARRLQLYSGSNTYRVNVFARDGTVTLAGTAASRAEADVILQAARSAPGVRAVNDRIDIAPLADDAQVKNALQAAFAAERIRPQAVNYEVRNGVAYFSGRTNRHRDLDRLLSVALMTPGVRAIKSDVTVAK